MDEETQIIGLRYQALELAIRSGVGQFYNDSGFTEVDADKLVEAAKKFENYMNGEKDGN